MMKYSIIRSRDLGLSHMTLKFNRTFAAVEVYVCAKFHPAFHESSSSLSRTVIKRSDSVTLPVTHEYAA